MTLRKELALFLSKNGYEVEEITDFSHTLESILQADADLLLLDINIPNYDGQFLCREIRKQSKLPIIIVTSRNSDIDELLMLNYGADDYITKPYNPQILLAHVEAVLKRSLGTNHTILEYQELKLDISKSLVKVRDQMLELSKNEMKILYYLLQNSGTIVSREEIMTYLWDSEMYVDDNTLTVNINRLRRKLEDIGLTDIIQTRRGQGYIIL